MIRIPDRKRPHICRIAGEWYVKYGVGCPDHLVASAYSWMWSTQRWRNYFGTSG